MPNFPYPWYISQVRANLWNQWSSRMPAEEGLAVVVFTIMPDGSLVDIRIEESSGDPNFDLAAMASARDAGPFPPLPTGFDEAFLKVHVTLKSGR
jgi:TonB family protein